MIIPVATASAAEDELLWRGDHAIAIGTWGGVARGLRRAGLLSKADLAKKGK